jgi:YVTN family beta-propeller protein
LEPHWNLTLNFASGSGVRPFPELTNAASPVAPPIAFGQLPAWMRGYVRYGICIFIVPTFQLELDVQPNCFGVKQMRKAISVSASIAAVALAQAISSGRPAYAQLNSGQPQLLSTGQQITPLAPHGSTFQALNPGLADNPQYTAGQAVQTALSPDKKTLVVLTSGYNTQAIPTTGSFDPADSNEYVFVFDVSHRAAVQKQVIQVRNTYNGIAFSPTGTELFVAGGVSDNAHVYAPVSGQWTEEAGSPIALGHLAKAVPALANLGGLGLDIQPEAAGLALTADGQKLVVANFENDSISELTKSQGGNWTVTSEFDLRPGKIDPSKTGVPGGEYPFWVSIKGNDTAYVSTIRDREIDVVDISGATPAVTTRIALPGQPNKMTLNKAQTRLFVAQDNSDSIAVIDTGTQTVLTEIKVTAPALAYANTQNYKGANPNNLTLSPDESTLYVTNAGENAVAVVHLNRVLSNSRVIGLIPTGWYPNSVSVSGDGKSLYIVNGKSAAGPNPQEETGSANQYMWQITKAGFQTVPVPEDDDLEDLTARVLENDRFLRGLTEEQRETMAQLHRKIHHVIYIIKENRTYDQVLGDLEVGNGDPNLTMYPDANTPNLHNIARNFVDFDNFYDTSDVSGDGWPWSTSARTTDVIEKEIPVNYGVHGGLANESEGTNRNINVGIGDIAQRTAADPALVVTGPGFTPDPDLLPGSANVAAPDSDDDKPGEGYLWDSALKAGLSVRDYGFFIDIVRYVAPPSLGGLPEIPSPAALTPPVQVAFSTNAALSPYTDPYFRGFDQSFPDFFLYGEWKREFDGYVAGGNLPNLTLLRLPHDHTGNFSTAINGVNTPELQVADNDYAVGLVASAVAKSPYAKDTLIFVIEDDAQDGADHVDAHRSIAFVIGPYVKQGFVDSMRYNTVSMVRTIEDILGIPHLNLNDDHAQPMASAFDLHQSKWSFDAVPSGYLQNTTLPITFPAASTDVPALKPLHDATWWAAETKGMNFSVEDKVDTTKFNRVLWLGTMGGRPYPGVRSGADLSRNRAALLAQWRHSHPPADSTQTGGGAE